MNISFAAPAAHSPTPGTSLWPSPSHWATLSTRNNVPTVEFPSASTGESETARAASQRARAIRPSVRRTLRLRPRPRTRPTRPLPARHLGGCLQVFMSLRPEPDGSRAGRLSLYIPSDVAPSHQFRLNGRRGALCPDSTAAAT